ncbi:response regulator [Pedobacter insulae]|uniref:Response regulator receiver domain-containing protein n=1 Tax=Pedobacter insulae TaxID=414048 RepID=A0A1I2XXG3_9SPHI|nr:response regulator [Pedobacter insulae]SFH16771.1 Response regulator receiver domain-containing protein [Pedobacter insulae]
MKRILVVDDDDDVLETTQLILEIAGYDVEPLNDAELIFDRIEEFEPNLIILDIVLGKIDGRVICGQIKCHQDTKDIPVLMMSGLYDIQEVQEMECAPDDFMSKPFKMDVLLEKIEKLVNKKKPVRYDIN